MEDVNIVLSYQMTKQIIQIIQDTNKGLFKAFWNNIFHVCMLMVCLCNSYIFFQNLHTINTKIRWF